MMIGIFVAFLIIFLLLFILSKGKYNDMVEPLDEKEYRLKKILSMGLFVLEKVGYKYNTLYDRKLLNKFAEIYGAKYSYYYLQIHWASIITASLGSLTFVSLLGISTGPDIGIGVIALLALLLSAYLPDKMLSDKVKERHLLIQMEFPEFVNKLSLLVNAGMNINMAWKKVSNDSKSEGPLFNELRTVVNEIENGKHEIQAYEDFAKRCRMQEISKFISLIIVNMKKGSGELISNLRILANDSWEMRKHAARRLGEEAGAKMMIPLAIMMLAVFIIVGLPAVLAISSGT